MENEVPDDLPENIRMTRHRLKLTQQGAGALFGVSDTTFARWERGLGLDALDAAKLVALADWLKAPLDVLVTDIAENFTNKGE